jgi:thiol-disulfide isomerase/thioredoxin
MTQPTGSADDSASTEDRLLVACLCAEWCTACRAYRAVFEQAAAEHPDVSFVWVDIEDSAALMDQVEVENFPTILIGEREQPRFFGAITPQPEVLLRLIAAHRRRGSEDARLGEEVGGLLKRLHSEETR